MSDNASVRPITEVADRLGIRREHLQLYGDDKAKVASRRASNGRPPGRLVLVSAITPTAAGEGKTTTSIGLAQGLAQARRVGLPRAARAVARPDLRHEGRRDRRRRGRASSPRPTSTSTSPATSTPSPRPTTCSPRCSTTTSTTATRLDIDPRRVLWRRVIDMNDRALRHIVIGLGGVLRGRAARDRLRHHAGLRGDGDALPRRGRRGPAARGSPRIVVALTYEQRAGHRGRPRRRRAR